MHKCLYQSIFFLSSCAGRESNFQKVQTNNLGTPYDFNSVMHYSKWVYTCVCWSIVNLYTSGAHALRGEWRTDKRSTRTTDAIDRVDGLGTPHRHTSTQLLLVMRVRVCLFVSSSRYAFSKNGQPTIIARTNPNLNFGRATEMSQNDIHRVNRLYQCSKWKMMLRCIYISYREAKSSTTDWVGRTKTVELKYRLSFLETRMSLFSD